MKWIEVSNDVRTLALDHREQRLWELRKWHERGEWILESRSRGTVIKHHWHFGGVAVTVNRYSTTQSPTHWNFKTIKCKEQPQMVIKVAEKFPVLSWRLSLSEPSRCEPKRAHPSQVSAPNFISKIVLRSVLGCFLSKDFSGACPNLSGTHSHWQRQRSTYKISLRPSFNRTPVMPACQAKSQSSLFLHLKLTTNNQYVHLKLSLEGSFFLLSFFCLSSWVWQQIFLLAFRGFFQTWQARPHLPGSREELCCLLRKAGCVSCLTHPSLVWNFAPDCVQGIKISWGYFWLNCTQLRSLVINLSFLMVPSF